MQLQVDLESDLTFRGTMQSIRELIEKMGVPAPTREFVDLFIYFDPYSGDTRKMYSTICSLRKMNEIISHHCIDPATRYHEAIQSDNKPESRNIAYEVKQNVRALLAA